MGKTTRHLHAKDIGPVVDLTGVVNVAVAVAREEHALQASSGGHRGRQWWPCWGLVLVGGGRTSTPSSFPMMYGPEGAPKGVSKVTSLRLHCTAGRWSGSVTTRGVSPPSSQTYLSLTRPFML